LNVGNRSATEMSGIEGSKSSRSANDYRELGSLANAATWTNTSLATIDQVIV